MLALLLTACKRGSVSGQNDSQNEVFPMESMEVSDSFTWATHKEITFHLSSDEPGIAQVISGEKNAHAHYRTRLIPGEQHTLIVAVPAYENRLLVKFRDQQKEFDITNGGQFTHEFSGAKTQSQKSRNITLSR